MADESKTLRILEHRIGIRPENNQNTGDNKKSWFKDLTGSLIWLATLSVTLIGLITLFKESATVSNSVNGRELPIYCVETDKPQVALSFDAAWGNEDTKTLLNILEKNQVKTTFFMTGEWVEAYPEDVKLIHEKGHDLGNHSENHKNMSQITAEECVTEIEKVHEKVRTLTGVEMNLFRPPYGDYDNKVMKTVQSLGYYGIQWSVDSLDWKDYGAADIVKKVTEHKNLKNGAIILMHNGAKYTPEALDEVIHKLREKGFEIVSISELIYLENYHMKPDGTQVSEASGYNSRS